MAGKYDSHRHSATSFSENVVLVDTSYEVSQVLFSFLFLLGDGLTSFNLDKSANFFGVKMYNEAIRDVYYLRIREKKNCKLNLLLLVVLVLESKGRYYLAID